MYSKTEIEITKYLANASAASRFSGADQYSPAEPQEGLDFAPLPELLQSHTTRRSCPAESRGERPTISLPEDDLSAYLRSWDTCTLSGTS